MTCRPPCVLALASAVFLVRPSVAIAQTDDTVADPAAAPRTVEVVLAAGNPAEAPALESIVRELLSRLHVVPVVTRVARVDPVAVVTPRADADPAVLARLWLDLGAGRVATLYVADGAWERILVRHVVRVPGAEEVSREALGRLLEAAVEALLSGARIGLSRDEVRPTLVPPPVPASPVRARVPIARWWRVQLGVHYEAQGFSSVSLIEHGPAVSVLAGFDRVPARPSLWLTGQYRLPTVVATSPVGVRLDTGSARLLLAGEWSLGPVVSLRLGVGGGLDVVRIEPRSNGATALVLDPPGVAVYPMIRALAALHVRVLPGIGLLAALGCDVDPTASRYVVVQGGTVDPVLEPWPVRPVVSLGMTAP